MDARDPEVSITTRRQLLDRLRSGPATVETLAARAGVTPNAIRRHLAVLEAAGQVERAGEVRPGTAGKPPLLYALTERGQAGFSRAYPPVLSALVATLSERLPPDGLRDVFDAAGQRLAPAPSAPVADRAAVAVAVLESLGARVGTSTSGGYTQITGAACPLAETVRHCPDSCEIVRALLARATGGVVRTDCEHGDQPRCRFTLV
ncbi:MAG TPA: helix-turn-helix domain-containing protein [Gemmatimonadales bacterium]|nr:helix-turn-helix domain-containing protein [Gemmatimonadales bacterium]